MGLPVERFGFGPFSLDMAGNRLCRDGVDVDLRPQALHALKVLLQNTGRHVDYERMIREAWDGTSVSRHTVAVTVGEVKKALKEYGSWISYRPKLGYRLEPPKSDDLVRKGWHLLNRMTREGCEQALASFERAAVEDCMDFRAFQGISQAYLVLGACGMRPPREVYRAFLEAHKRAVALGGMTPELRASRALGLHMFEKRRQEAEFELLRACMEDPNLPAAYTNLTMVYTSDGRFDEALELLNQARHVDPLWPVLAATEINVRFCRREFDCAVACGKQALELHPYLPLVRLFYALALEFAGRTEEALEQYRMAGILCPDLPWLRALEGACLAKLGRRAEARKILEELRQLRATEYVDAYYVALLYDALGDRDNAFHELERAREDNSAALPIVDVDPKMDSLRRDPRFARIRDGLFVRTAA